MARRRTFAQWLGGKVLGLALVLGVGPQASTSFASANQTRLNADWAFSILSADLEIRNSLRMLRARSRQLIHDNDYAKGFIGEVQKNVIGSTGIGMRSTIDDEETADAEVLNEQIEKQWKKFCNAKITACGRMSAVDFANLWLGCLLSDGEVFVRRLKGFDNDSRYAVELIDPDRVPVELNRRREVRMDGTVTNEVRMGVEVDQWRRPLAYHILTAHPTEGGFNYETVPAWQIEHTYVFQRADQTRGVPFMHTAMRRMNMLGGYEDAELVAARIAACKMGVITSKSGDEYPGQRTSATAPSGAPQPGGTGPIQIDVEPGSWFQLRTDMDAKAIDWQHPNHAFPEFVKAMLRGTAVGLGISYATLTGDLREVNYSSIRHGALSERDAWRSLQTFAVRHLMQPLFADWLGMAMLAGRLQLPAAPANDPDFYLDRVQWQPRGWTWIDPYKESQANIQSVRACMSTLADVAAAQGRDWKDVIDQRAAEQAYALKKGVVIDLGGAGQPVPTADGSGDANTADGATALLLDEPVEARVM